MFNAGKAMKSILFLDDWMVEHRDSLERVWGKPEFVKELFTDFYPGFLGYGGYMTVFHDEQVGRYVLYLAVFPPEADPGVFVVRLESDDPYEWPHPVYDAGATPAWKGFEKVVLDQHGQRFWPFSIRPLAGTPIADRGYVTGEWVMPPLADRRQAAREGVSALGFSHDGLNFEVDRDNPWRRPGSDVPGHITWNEAACRFHIYNEKREPGPQDRRSRSRPTCGASRSRSRAYSRTRSTGSGRSSTRCRRTPTRTSWWAS